jgi:hypothetical protein
MTSKVLALISLSLLLVASPLLASSGGSSEIVDLTGTGLGIFSLVLFVGAYLLVIFEEQLHMRKSKPVLLAAGIIWVLVAITFNSMGNTQAAHAAIQHNLIEYAELFLFLLAAMTYINAMDERNVFQALRSWLVGRGFTLRTIFWVTGLLAFVISPVADNLTTALLMGAVVMAVAGDNKKFLVVACINIVVAANAGGAVSPYGDNTPLMVWQKGKVEFYRVLYHFRAVTGELAHPCVDHEYDHRQRAPRSLEGCGQDEAGRQADHGSVPLYHRHRRLLP